MKRIKPSPIEDKQTTVATPEVENVDLKLGETVTLMGMSYQAPLWRTKEAENGYSYHPFEEDADCALSIAYQSFPLGGKTVNSSLWDSYIEGLDSDTFIDRQESTTYDGVPQLRLRYKKDVSGTTYMVDSATFITNDYLYTMIIGMPHEISDEVAQTFDAIIASVFFETVNSAENPKQESTPQSIGQRNALETAESYLSIMPFSYSGLISQLEYEKFSHEDAVYAADNCGADWYEQAAIAAKNYLDLMSFSRSSLIEQLEYEGYSHDEAVYGVEANGY